MKTGTTAKAAQTIFKVINILVSVNMLIFFAIFAFGAIQAQSWWPFLWSLFFLILALICLLAYHFALAAEARKILWFVGIVCAPIGYCLILIFWVLALSTRF